MTHIQIPNLPPRITYTGNGSQTLFTYPFPIFQTGDLAVTINDVPQINTCAVTGAGSTTGGSVVFDTPPADGALVTLERILPIQRISDFLEGGELAANALNNEFDFLTACLQQVQDGNRMMLRFEKSEETSSLLPARANRLNRVLGFDEDGEMTLYETAETYAAPSIVQIGTGAVSRSVTDKMRDSVTVTDFGAIGDGVADDTSAIQAALNAHDHVYLPPGMYRITTNLSVSDNKRLEGAGTSSVIKANSSAFDTIEVMGSNAQLCSFVIDGGDSALRLYGKLSPCRGNIFINLIIRNANIGIELDGYTNTANPCRDNIFSAVIIEKPLVHGVHLRRSGIGAYPHANSFNGVRVLSLGTSLTGSGFYVEAAKYNNSFINCHADLKGSAIACFRIGASSARTLLTNLSTACDQAIPNLQLENGSVDTAVTNLYASAGGAAILDNSGGKYTALNAGTAQKNLLDRTRISDLTIDQQRYTFQAVALASNGTVNIDLSKTTYLVDATNADTTLALPLASGTNQGAVITVKKTDSSTRPVSISEIGGNGPDGRIVTLGSQHDTACVMSDGTAWRILTSNVMPYSSISVSGLTTYHPDLTRALHLVNSVAGICTVELPFPNASQAIGRIITVKKSDASANAVRLTIEGGTGPDGAVQTITTQYKSITVMSTGTTWCVISKYV